MSDIILEVVDSRTPKLSRIKFIEDYAKTKNKVLIIVINKSDLVPEGWITDVKEKFEIEFPTVYVSARTRKGSRTLRRVIKQYSPDKDKIYIGVVGYPNTGKSSIINMLVGRHRSKTSSYAGFTKGMQIIKLSSKHYIIDSPGIIPVKDKKIALLIGAINPEEMDNPIIFAKYLYEKLPKSFLKETYKIDFSSFMEFLEKISVHYNIRSKDKLNRASIKFMKDWVLGKIRGYIA